MTDPLSTESVEMEIEVLLPIAVRRRRDMRFLISSMGIQREI